ncbi:phosphatidylinositol-3,5-bisphosphate 3-phosphatase MTMR14-like isoform X2 [Apostichopus japonicus]|uniref:phosphatidylinositol-3,5-bisphosphate 3-phosphatase MTMR14-like isoform X2 n=1 Tax=Stichopus japonicus TaxID=307972 RepID=UPI003AB7292C
MGDKVDLINEEDIRRTVEHFTKNVYRAKDGSSFCEAIERKCQALFAKDYQFTVIHNGNGELCSHYPTKLIIQEYEVSSEDHPGAAVEPLYDIAKLRDFMYKTRLARCRGRFVVPVILFDGKHICRSATLAGGAEIYGRSGLHYIFSGGLSQAVEPNDTGIVGSASNNDWPLMDRVRAADINLLQMLSVTHICDLMLENKKVKFGVYVSSSEKIDKERRYDDFCLISTPYPGCEFFKDYRDNGFNAEGIKFDWSQQFVDASLSIPDSVVAGTTIDWHMYRAWDLIKITQNYLKLQLSIITKNDAGLLVHCISGWDRTPLFISLLRLSLWADGRVNASLTAIEILYLTISYDWLLFGHNLSDRLDKGEDIFFFCFNFLRHITSSEFSVVRPNRTINSSCESMVLLDKNSGSVLDGSIPSSHSSSKNTSHKNLDGFEGTSQFSENQLKCNSVIETEFYPGKSNALYSSSEGPSGTSNPVSSPIEVPLKEILELAKNEATPPSACGRSDLQEGQTTRKQKLEEVSHLFRRIYSSVVKGRDYPEAGGITTVFDSISSKIGFKNL